MVQKIIKLVCPNRYSLPPLKKFYEFFGAQKHKVFEGFFKKKGGSKNAEKSKLAKFIEFCYPKNHSFQKPKVFDAPKILLIFERFFDC
jgi:hypothetical protein